MDAEPKLSNDAEPGELSPERGKALLALVVVAMFLPAIGTWLYFDVFAGNRVMQVVYGGAKIVQLALPVVAYFLIEQRISYLPPHGPKRKNFARGLGIGGAFGVVVGLAMLGLYYGWLADSPLLASGPQMIASKIGDFGMVSPLKFLAFALFISVLHSLLEEYYFRWFIFRRLQAFVSPATAVALSSLAFMGHHVIVLMTFFPASTALALFFSFCIALGGAFWAWLFQRTGSLRGAWLSHFLVDCAIMWLGYEMVDWSKLAGG